MKLEELADKARAVKERLTSFGDVAYRCIDPATYDLETRLWLGRNPSNRKLLPTPNVNTTMDEMRDGMVFYFESLVFMLALQIVVRLGYLPVPLLLSEMLPFVLFGWAMPVFAFLVYEAWTAVSVGRSW